jgi:hypothetical protein
MPFTGVDFNNQLDLATDFAYTGYYDSAKKNRFVQEALVKAIEIKVASNDRIQPQDDLYGIFKANIPFALINNEIGISEGGSGISDYHHAMTLKARFIQRLRDTAVISATNTTPIRITANTDTNLRTGQSVLIASVTGNTNANGIRYVRRIKNNIFELYSDVNLLIPVIGNGTYTGVTGQISRIVYNTATNLKSGRKFSTLNKPTVYDPYFEISGGSLKVYPLEDECTEILLDYISIPIPIDVGDNTTDLLQIYSKRFLMFIMDDTVRLMANAMRDQGLSMQAQAELIQQP